MVLADMARSHITDINTIDTSNIYDIESTGSSNQKSNTLIWIIQQQQAPYNYN